MTDNGYKSIEITGSSTESIEGAVQTALHRAGENLPNLRGFQVQDICGYLNEDAVAHWQVTEKI